MISEEELKKVAKEMGFSVIKRKAKEPTPKRTKPIKEFVIARNAKEHFGEDADIIIKFATNLQRLMDEKGVTQVDVANATAIKTSTLSVYRRGLRNPLMTSVIKISNYLGVTIDEFMK